MRCRPFASHGGFFAVDSGNATDLIQSILNALRHRALLSVLFVLLMLGMQHEVQVHAFQHLGAALHAAQEQGLQAPVADIVCLECALLAGGASALAPEFPAVPPAAVGGRRFIGALATRALSAPAYYSSRAPPPLL